MSDNASVSMDWDTYWRGSRDGAAYAHEGVDHPLIGAFWQRELEAATQANSDPSLLDVASGNGAVIDTVQRVYGEDAVRITCLDSSDAAINSLVERYPSVEGVVGDAREMRFPDASFDIVTSQFGVEYAGLEAIDEMARLVATGGKLIALMHIRDGLIDRECRANFDAIRELQGIRFINAARHMFTEARKCLRGESPGNSRVAYDEAVQAMLPVFRQLGSLIERCGENVAGGTLRLLHREVDRIHSRIMHHDMDEVLAWLETMDAELLAYNGRMQSMTEAAVSADEFKTIVARLTARDFDIATAEGLQDDASTLAVAWMLVATRCKRE